MGKMTALLMALPLLAGCVGLPAGRSISCADARRPLVAISPDGRTASARIDVLTYNVEGLPNRLREGRGSQLKAIGLHLARLRAAGRAPDVVLFQEVFSRSARSAVEAAGYPSLASGPTARTPQPPRRKGGLPGRSNPRRGETGAKLASSGLVIAAEYPILRTDRRPFAKGSCAGFDCLSNKGVMAAEIAIPGVPEPIALFNTHLNSQGASRVPERRHTAAHRRQTAEIGRYISARGGDLPVIFGGDFNMRGSEPRFEAFDSRHDLALVHRWCLAEPQRCEIALSWDGDAPWLDTQDLQLFRPGERVAVRPVRVEAMFDGGGGGPRLSDHDGFRVIYELSWRTDSAAHVPCPAEPALASGDVRLHMPRGSRADGALANPVRSGRKQP